MPGPLGCLLKAKSLSGAVVAAGLKKIALELPAFICIILQKGQFKGTL